MKKMKLLLIGDNYHEVLNNNVISIKEGAVLAGIHFRKLGTHAQKMASKKGLNYEVWEVDTEDNGYLKKKNIISLKIMYETKMAKAGRKIYAEKDIVISQ